MVSSTKYVRILKYVFAVSKAKKGKRIMAIDACTGDRAVLNKPKIRCNKCGL